MISVNESNFEAEVLKAAVDYVLVDFWAEWCGPCKMLSPILENLSVKFEGKIKFVKLNTDEATSLAQDYQITGIPCCILFKEGKDASRIVGFKDEKSYEAELVNLTSA